MHWITGKQQTLPKVPKPPGGGAGGTPWIIVHFVWGQKSELPNGALYTWDPITELTIFSNGFWKASAAKIIFTGSSLGDPQPKGKFWFDINYIGQGKEIIKGGATWYGLNLAVDHNNPITNAHADAGPGPYPALVSDNLDSIAFIRAMPMADWYR
jgi:hypothetical protein